MNILRLTILFGNSLFIGSAETFHEYRARKVQEHLEHVESVNSKALKEKYEKNLRMKPLQIRPQGYLLIESFDSDSECNQINSDKFTGIAAGQCINYGADQGSFIYQYQFEEGADDGSVQLFGNFYRDDYCKEFGYREDNLSKHKLNECTKDRLVNKYYKYHYSNDPKNQMTYSTGFQTR